MALRTEEICIEEISFEDYQRIKTRQYLKPPRQARNNTLYGQITQTTSTTPERIARDILEDPEAFNRINCLRRIEGAGGFFLRRFVVYNSTGFVNQDYATPSSLSDLIRQGRGIDLLLRGSSSQDAQERHLYRIAGDNLILVKIAVPKDRWVHYKFRKNSGSGFTRLEAAFLMPDNLVQLEMARRKT